MVLWLFVAKSKVSTMPKPKLLSTLMMAPDKSNVSYGKMNLATKTKILTLLLLKAQTYESLVLLGANRINDTLWYSESLLSCPKKNWTPTKLKLNTANC